MSRTRLLRYAISRSTAADLVVRQRTWIADRNAVASRLDVAVSLFTRKFDGLLLLPLIAACGAKPPPRDVVAPAPQSSEADAATSEDAGADAAENVDAGPKILSVAAPVDAAALWLNAIRTSDAGSLSALSRFPFFFHATGTEGECGNGAAADGYQVLQLVNCLVRSQLVMTDLRGDSELLVSVLKAKEIPAWARRWRSEVPDKATLVQVDVPGRGNTFHFVVVVVEGGVQAVWKHATFESTEGAPSP